MAKGTYIPQDLINEILVRLPAKSLMRFKCVDRSWNALFKTPTFIIRNTQMLMQDNERLIIMTDNYNYRCNNYYNNISMILASDGDVSNLKCPLLDNNNKDNELLEQVVPCCSHNGVVFLRGYDMDGYEQLFMWNPATREVKVIPPPPNCYLPPPSFNNNNSSNKFKITKNVYRYPSKPITDACIMFWGFGGDPNTNELKIIDFRATVLGTIAPFAELYTLSTNTWTTLKLDDDTFPLKLCQIFRDENATLANGVCHWLVQQDEIDLCILCFDFHNNQFYRLDLPSQSELDYRDNDFDTFPFIAEINDSIAYISAGDYPTWTPEIWTLESASAETRRWNKIYKFGPFGCYMSFFNFWKNGREILGEWSRDMSTPSNNEPIILASYNSHGQVMRLFEEITIDPIVNGKLFVRKYVESIVPLSSFL